VVKLSKIWHSRGKHVQISKIAFIWTCDEIYGGPCDEKGSQEFLDSKRDDRLSNPFFEMVPKTCQGSFFVPSLA